MSQVYLEIGNLATLTAFIADAKKNGLLKDISAEQVEMAFRGKTFPIRIPVDLSAVLDVAGNMVVRKTFGRQIEKKTVDILNQALRLG